MSFACSVVSVSLVNVVTVQPSTVTEVPPEVVTLTVMSSLSGLKMNETPPSTKGASEDVPVPPPASGICAAFEHAVKIDNAASTMTAVTIAAAPFFL